MTSSNTETKQGCAVSGCGRLHYWYRGCRVWIFVVFRGIKHVETIIEWTAASDNNQCANRSSHEGKSSKDDSEDDGGDVRATA